MKNPLNILLALVLLSSTPGILVAEENIKLSDDYFEISASENELLPQKKNNQIAKNENEGILSIEPSPNWNLQRDRENELIEEVSFKENSFDGIITQRGIELAKNTPDVMQSGNQNPLNSDVSNDSSLSSKMNEESKNKNGLPKTLKVRPESQPDEEEPIVESNLGDWVFDFPK